MNIDLDNGRETLIEIEVEGEHRNHEEQYYIFRKEQDSKVRFFFGVRLNSENNWELDLIDPDLKNSSDKLIEADFKDCADSLMDAWEWMHDHIEESCHPVKVTYTPAYYEMKKYIEDVAGPLGL